MNHPAGNWVAFNQCGSRSAFGAEAQNQIGHKHIKSTDQNEPADFCFKFQMTPGLFFHQLAFKEKSAVIVNLIFVRLPLI